LRSYFSSQAAARHRRLFLELAKRLEAEPSEYA
jgi:hypothetical protein